MPFYSHLLDESITLNLHGALVKYIADTGETAPKDASCNGPSGYWYLAAQVLSGKSNPSFKFVAAVASYWYHNRSDLCVQNMWMEKLRRKELMM